MSELKNDPATLSIADIASHFLARLRQATDHGRWTTDVSYCAETPVLVDGKLIRSALAQLVDNAIKYSTPGSRIDVGFETRDTEALMTMRSRGLVIAPADRERIFERFYRAPEAQHGSAGTGLGLSIVKRIVEAHHGRVWVESDVDDGTVFSLALPTVPKKPQ